MAIRPSLNWRSWSPRRSASKAKLRYDSPKPDGTPLKLMDVSRIKALVWGPRIGLREGVTATCRAALLVSRLAGEPPCWRAALLASRLAGEPPRW